MCVCGGGGCILVVAVSEKQLGQSLEWPFQKSPCFCWLFVSIRTHQFWNLFRTASQD